MALDAMTTWPKVEGHRLPILLFPREKVGV